MNEYLWFWLGYGLGIVTVIVSLLPRRSLTYQPIPIPMSDQRKVIIKDNIFAPDAPGTLMKL